MDTLTIRVNNAMGLKLIRDLEALDIIKIIEAPLKKKQKKLSEIMSGSVTKEQGEAMHNELKQMRNEWERDTY